MVNQEILRSAITKFRKGLWSPFTKAVSNYELLEEGDKIAVCISGGKDSFVLALLLTQIQMYGDIKFDLEYLCLNPGYTEETLNKIQENADKLGIELKYFPAEIFPYLDTLKQKPCYLCSRMRRGYLYRYARELGCNKIALGHHYDDVLETILISMFYAGQFKSMVPKLRSTNFEGMSLIRPLFLVEEKDIIAFWKYWDLNFIQCACSLSERLTDTDKTEYSKRAEVKELIKELSGKNPYFKANLFRSLENVSVETVLSYKEKGEIHSFFMEEFEEKK